MLLALDPRLFSPFTHPDKLSLVDAETAISIIFGAVLASFSFAVVFYSFMRGRRPERPAGDSLPDNDDPALADIFDAMTTLDLEYQLGRMPQEDFQIQFQAYRLQAATVLREQLEAGRGDPAWVLEQEILLARGDLESAVSRAVECPNCSASMLEGTLACPQCGAEIAHNFDR